MFAVEGKAAKLARKRPYAALTAGVEARAVAPHT
jgi:hypothetical protein